MVLAGGQIFDFEKERQIRDSRKMTRRYVAEALNIDVSNLYRMEKNGCETNNLDFMNDLAGLYGCYLDDFVKDEYCLQ